jgi:hypothetical protein
VSVKKAKGKGKGTKRKSAKKREPAEKKPKDMVQVRENINNLVRDSAEEIATGVIKVAKTGQLTSAKYLFEAAGLYPATEQTMAKPLEGSLAYTLLKRMGLPVEPVVCDEDATTAVPVSDAEGIAVESDGPSVAEEDGEAAIEEEREPVAAADEE